MALPSLEMPATVPDWRYAPHDVQAGEPYARVQFITGQPRVRRTSVGTVQQMQAEMLCTQAQAQALHTFYEEDLDAGSLPFAARVLAPDGSREWWHARFVQPPAWDGVHATGGPLWRVRATLRLEGIASEVAPS